jgi:hypothetical protein
VPTSLARMTPAPATTAINATKAWNARIPSPQQLCADQADKAQ